MMSATVLIVDDEANFRDNLYDYLNPQGYEVFGVETMKEAQEFIHQGKADIVLLDVSLPDGYGPDLLDETENLQDRPPIILITAYGEIDMAVEAMKKGAHDFLQKPVEFSRLDQTLQRAKDKVAMRRELEHYRQEHQKDLDFCIGDSPEMRNIIHKAQRAAKASVSVLLTGPTGTGKEVLARAIYKMGPRAHKPFIAINCAAIQPTVLESELFGYEAGAFTGATKRKPGLMEVANEGILFLDEISAMPLEMQPKILRAIDEHEFRRVGGTNSIHVDVQIIAASNKDLPTMIERGEFREDLYYRLKVVDLHLPTLSRRKEDIPELVGMFLRDLNPRMGKNVRDITPRALDALMAYSWPGNIRELRNAIEHALLFCDEDTLDLPHLPADVTPVPA
jgi:DNA-binding NtrC family response regulator